MLIIGRNFLRTIVTVSPWKSETEIKTERRWMGKPQKYTLSKALFEMKIYFRMKVFEK